MGNNLAIHFIVQTSGIFSVVGSLFIVISFLLFKKLRQDDQTRQVLFLGVSDFFIGVAYSMGDGQILGSSVCYIQAVIITFFELASVLWSCNIATGILVSIIQPRKRVRILIEIYYHLFGWGLPLIVTVVFIAAGVPGHEAIDAGGWCWVSQENYPQPAARILWQVAGLYLFLWGACFYILGLFVGIGIYVQYKNRGLKSKIDQLTYAAIKKRNLTIILKFFLYPVVLIICYFFAIVNETVGAFSNQNVFFLLVLHSIFAHSIGFTNCIVYGISQNVFKMYLEIIKKCIDKVKKKNVPSVSDQLDEIDDFELLNTKINMVDPESMENNKSSDTGILNE